MFATEFDVVFETEFVELLTELSVLLATELPPSVGVVLVVLPVLSEASADWLFSELLPEAD